MSQRLGQKARRKAEFIPQHPWCCFCGGAAPTTSEDHQPAKAVFDGRGWPEGYVFPACDPCNAISRHDELIVGMLSRIRSGQDGNPSHQVEFAKALRGVANNFPHVYPSMKMTANEKRASLRENNLAIAPGTFLNDVPLARVDHPRFQTALRQFSIKLMCALHYKHAEEIVPASGVISGRWYSNLQVMTGAIPAEFAAALRGRARVVRGRKDLSEQFDYWFEVLPDKTMSVFLCGFRSAFAVAGSVSYEDSSDFPEEQLDRGIFRGGPFRHDNI